MIVLDESHIYHINSNYKSWHNRNTVIPKIKSNKYLLLSANETRSDIYVPPTFSKFDLQTFPINTEIFVQYPINEVDVFHLMIDVVEMTNNQCIKPIFVCKHRMFNSTSFKSITHEVNIKGRTKTMRKVIVFGGKGITFFKAYNQEYTNDCFFVIPTTIIEGITLDKSNAMFLFSRSVHDNNPDRLYQRISRVCRVGNMFDTIYIGIDSRHYFTRLFVKCLSYLYDIDTQLSLCDVALTGITYINVDNLNEFQDYDSIDVEELIELMFDFNKNINKNIESVIVNILADNGITFEDFLFVNFEVMKNCFANLN